MSIFIALAIGFIAGMIAVLLFKEKDPAATSSIEENLEIIETCTKALDHARYGLEIISPADGVKVSSKLVTGSTRDQLEKTIRAAASRLEALTDPAKFPNPEDY